MILFNSTEFALFFIVVYSVYLLSNHRWQNRWLLIASYVFYGSWNWKFLSLIWISTIVDYYCGIKIFESSNQKSRKVFLCLSMCTNLGILGFFKYFNFFSQSFRGMMGLIGWHVDPFTLHVILPVGISFYTFQTMSYTIDIYRKEIEPTRHFLNFALFVTFFPQLVAGPIERAKNLLPQILHKRTITLGQFNEGCWLIYWGLFKKIFIADNLAKIVDGVFATQAPISGAEVLMSVYAFAFQIYGDFSGYSDIARGVSKLLGFELMLNFKMPYFAGNIRCFWQRWHISLSTWLKDYLYISMGGNRGRPLLTYRNLILTMTLGGLWHGAAWNFVLWGVFHGVILILHRIIAPVLSFHTVHSFVLRKLWKGICIITTFHVVCFGWLLFRAQSFFQIKNLLHMLLFNFRITPQTYQYAFDIFICTGFIFFIQLFKERYKDMNFVIKTPSWVRGGIYFIIFLSLVLGGVQGGREFIYFQF